MLAGETFGRAVLFVLWRLLLPLSKDTYSAKGRARATNTPQSIGPTVPGRASSIAAEIVSMYDLTTGQLIADMIKTAKGSPSSCC